MTQSGGQAAGIQLQVGLDLAYFRGQMQKVNNIASSEFTSRLDVRFNKKTLDAELNNLQRAIKRRVYRVEIGGNLSSLPGQIKDLREQLSSLEDTKIDVGVGAVKSLSKKDAQKIKTDLRQSILSEDKKILVPVSIKSSITREDVRNFENAVKSKLSGLSIDVKANVKGGGFAGSPGMKGALPVGTEALGLKKGAGQPGAKEIKALYEALAMAGVEGFGTGIKKTRAQMVTEIGAVAKDTVAGLLNGLDSQDAKVQAAAKSLGESLIASMKAVLGIASPSKKFEEIGKNVGKGFEKGALSSMDNAFDAMERKMRQRGKILDTIARGIFGMLGMNPAAMMQQARALPPLNFGATVPRAPAGIGPSSSGRMLPAAPSRAAIAGTPAPAGLLPSLSSAGQSKAIIEALIASTGPRLLPSGGGDDSLGKLAAPRQTKDAVDAILRDYFKVVEAQVKEVFSAPPIKKESLNIFDHLDTEQYFNYLAQARINAENAIRQSIEEAKQVTKQNQIKDAAQSFLRALETTVRNAERSIFLQSRIAASQSYVQKANIREIGQPLLGGRQVAAPKMLSAATGFYRGASTSPLPETQAQLFARREREARMRSALRSVDVMGETPTRAPARYSYANRPAMPRRPTSAIVPYEGGGALVPTGGGAGAGVPPRPPSGGGGMGGAGSFGRALGGINLPGAGLVREIGNEFAMATKQVLLFGTAYKALAFLTSFPAQVAQAVGALQSFNNTLKAISPTADEARASNQFILDIVDRYNVPLQSARDGFTKLYASMAPAGFKGDEIRALFTGVSQAAATFGMSADKVDRVNYAFAQMASKGQVMSEELKGQLGDVLPGAMGIFAKAAGFEGTDAIQKFSKALEEGAYKGKPMRDLLKNVSIELTKEFGPGAEGAARTFQGAINRMQNSTKLLYEAFEPVAVGFLNSVVVPLTSGIKTITDGFNAFFTGQAAQTAGGSVFAKQLEALRPAFEGIAANIKQILPLLQSFASTALSLGQVLLQIAGNPFVGYLARIYLSVLPLTMALRVLNLQAIIPLIGSFLRAIPAFISFNAAMMSGAGTNRALIATMQLTGQTAGITAGKIRLVSAALATLGNTAILAGIGLLVERFMMMKGAIDGVRQSTQQMLGSISGMANSGAVRELKNVGKDLQKQRETFEELRSFVSGGVIAGGAKRLTEAGAKKFEDVGMGSFVKKDVFGKPYIADFLRASEIIEEKLKGLDKQSSKVQEKLPLAAKIAANLARQAQSAQAIAPIPGSDGAGKPPKEQSLESYYSLQDQLAKNFTQAEIDRLEAEHQRKVDLIKAEYDLKETRANSFQREALKFERRMAEIGLEREGALLKASNDVLAAQGSVAGGAGGGGAGGGGKGLGAGIAQYITGDPSSPFYRADHGGGNYHEHLAFVSRQAAEEAYKKLTSAGIQVTEFKGMSRVGRHTPGSAHYEGLAFDVPGAQVPVGRERELTARVQSILGIGGARPAPVPASQKRDIIADQKVQIEQAKQSVIVRQAEAKAIKDAEIALADFVATATPVEEQKLQNDLLKRKTELMMQGYSDSAVDQAMKFAEAEYKVNFALKLNDELQKKGKRTKAEADAITKQMTEGLTAYSSALKENTIQLRDNQLAQAMTVLKDRMAMAGAITPDQELREQIRQRNPDFTPEQQEGLFQQEKLVQGAEKLKADMQGIASSIGDSFGTAFKGIITGSMTAQEALAGMFQSIADHFADMVAKMIAEWIKMMVLKGIEAIINPMAGLGNLGGGAGLNAASALGTNPNVAAYAPLSVGYANGGIAPGGFTAFANGGMVTGPTMGLVGEGRYNEAIVPLPDGKSIPVELSGGGSAAPTVIVNVDAKGSQVEGNEQNANQLGRVISAAVQTELIKQQRPGGLLAR